MESEGILNEPKDESIQSKNDDTDDYFSKKIKELNALLDEEIAKAEKPNMEDFDDPEIQQQNKQIEELKKQIEANKIDIDKDYNIVCQEQLKLFDNFQKDLEEKFNSYEKLVIDEINDLKENLNKQTNKQFDNIIKDIKEKINGDIKNQTGIQNELIAENENNYINEKKENTNNTNNYNKGFKSKTINKENPNDSDCKRSNYINKDEENPEDSVHKKFNNSNEYEDQLNDSNKKIDIQYQSNNNNVILNNKRISKNMNVKREPNMNVKREPSQYNEQKKIIINPEKQSIGLRTIKMDKNLGDYNRNSYIFEDKNENPPYNQYNNFLKNNTNNSNLFGYNQNNKKKIDNDKKKKEEPFKLKHNDIEVYDIDDKSKISNKANDQNQKIYQSINSIFFYDYEQKYIKDQKINEYKKEELLKEIFNDKITGRNILKNYYMNFIEENILPLFKKNKNIIQSKLETIKYNISIVLECLGMDKNFYNNNYYQYETNKPKFTRQQSQDAVLSFRREFNISKEDFTDAALEKKLIENNLDKNKTFGKIFGK